MKTYRIKIESRSPLLMHRGGLADPLDPWSKAMKEITGKRKKTEADYEELARLEWFGSMYIDEDDRPVIPGENIEGMLVKAGKKFRLGEAVRAGVLSDGNWPLVFKGPKTAKELWEAGTFRDARLESVNKGKVIRTRPRFDRWALDFIVELDTEQVSPDQLRQLLDTAGRIVSLGDRRPKFGRFEVKEFKAA